MPRVAKLSIFLALITAGMASLYFGLSRDDIEQKDVVIGKAFPPFQLSSLLDETTYINSLDFAENDYLLLNVWASWCGICKAEHPFLVELKGDGVPIIGLNYRDQRQAAINVLLSTGNPYAEVLFDSKGALALDIGVIGTPETYLISQQDGIVYRYSGSLNRQVWIDKFRPRIEELM